MPNVSLSEYLRSKGAVNEGKGVTVYGRSTMPVNTGSPDHPTSEHSAHFHFGPDYERWPHCRELIPAAELNPQLPEWAQRAFPDQMWLCQRERVDGTDRCDWHQPEPVLPVGWAAWLGDVTE